MQNIFCLLLLFLLLNMPAYAFITTSEEGICSPDSEKAKECLETPDSIQGTTSVDRPDIKSKPSVETPVKSKPVPYRNLSKTNEKSSAPSADRITIYFFWGDGCPHCREEKIFLAGVRDKYRLDIKDFEVWYKKENASLLSKMAAAYKLKSSGVPVTFIGAHAFIGFSKNNEYEMEKAFQECIGSRCIDPAIIASGKISIDEIRHTQITGKSAEDLECTEKSRSVDIPWLGRVDASKLSLPLITLVIAGLDSFNPCAFFVLFSLLSLLIHARSRQKMFLVGGIFVFFSGFIYFLFMAAWLNLFLVMGQVQIITKVAGFIAVLIALINIKDFFIFKKGISLTIPDSAKPGLFDRMRKLLKSSSLTSVLIGTTALAVAANSYELLCTAGFPMVFTRILTLNNLNTFSYYTYLLLYNIVYVIPLAVIVIIFTITLGKKQLSEWQGRALKLISGVMMLGLGVVLLIDPTILSDTLISFLLLSGSLAVSFIVILITKRMGYK